MRIDIKKELKKLEHMAELQGEVDEKHLTALVQLINAVRVLKHDDNIARDITDNLLDKYFLSIDNEIVSMDFNTIMAHSKIDFYVSFVNPYGCCVSLCLRNSYADKIFVSYKYNFSAWDANIQIYESAGKCIKDFLSRYNCLNELKSGEIRIRASDAYSTESMPFDEFVQLFKLDL